MRRFALGLLFTVASVTLLLRLIDWGKTRSALETADPIFITLAVTCLILSLAAKTVRWRLLLPSESRVSTPRLYRILHISFLLNNVLPARLGDVARIAMTSRQPEVRLGHVVSSMLTERVTDFITLLSCFVIVSPFLPLAHEYLSWLHIAWFTIAGLVLLTVLGIVLQRPLQRAFGRLPIPLPRNQRLGSEVVSFRDGWRQLFSRQHVVRIWGWSGIAWAGAFAINYLLMRALKIDAPITVAVLLTCATNLAMLLPSSPGYIGVFHAAAMLSLRPFGVAAPTAFAFAIIAHLVNVLPVSILGAAFLLAGREAIGFDPRSLRKAVRRDVTPPTATP
jgi:uncharacterized protein (TIRG00374 family)